MPSAFFPMHNLEFKAELRDPDLARSICRAIGAVQAAAFEQTDTYYRLAAGRFKKRVIPDEPTEYIFYDRPDRSGPKLSHFTIYSEADALARFGAQPLPEAATIHKKREVYMLGQVRIHLDEVTGLGRFLEFEAMVSPDHPIPACHKAIAELRATFAPVMGEPIAGGYIDLVEEGSGERAEPS
jgi:adenylate cyclase, class 2